MSRCYVTYKLELEFNNLDADSTNEEPKENESLEASSSSSTDAKDTNEDINEDINENVKEHVNDNTSKVVHQDLDDRLP